jgi:hypothetical protein
MIVNETLKIIKQRRSIRSFKDKKIKEEEITGGTGSGANILLSGSYSCIPSPLGARIDQIPACLLE